MDDPVVKIGDFEFKVPEFSGWAQRVVSPALTKASSLDMSDAKAYGTFLDTLYAALTIQTVDGKKDGAKVNEITKDDFENLRFKSIHLAKEVLPTLLRQAGLIADKDSPESKGGAAPMPGTPLNGASTSTIEQPI